VRILDARKMHKKDFVIVGLILGLAVSNGAWYVKSLPSKPTLPDDCFTNGNVYDCRRLSTFREAIVNVTNSPLNVPLSNVTVQLYTFQLELLSQGATNSSGIYVVKFPSNGTFYIELTYWIYFRQGGIEKWHKWVLFQANTDGDDFTLNMSLGPADWPTTPRLETP